MDFFKDHLGKLSMARLKAFALIMAGITIACYQAFTGGEIDHVIVIEFVGLGLGAKWLGGNQDLKKEKLKVEQKPS